MQLNHTFGGTYTALLYQRRARGFRSGARAHFALRIRTGQLGAPLSAVSQASLLSLPPDSKPLAGEVVSFPSLAKKHVERICLNCLILRRVGAAVKEVGFLESGDLVVTHPSQLAALLGEEHWIWPALGPRPSWMEEPGEGRRVVWANSVGPSPAPPPFPPGAVPAEPVRLL